MPQWVVLVPVTVEAATPDAAIAWVREELRREAAARRGHRLAHRGHRHAALPGGQRAAGGRGLGHPDLQAGAGMSDGRVTVAELAAELGISAATVIIDAMAAASGPTGGHTRAAQAEAIRAARRERLRAHHAAGAGRTSSG